jgi:phosphodiesterase/alkaline phosphatase D-like protein
MATLLWRKARHTTTTQAFWVCDTSNTGGQLGVRVATTYAALGAASITTGDTLGSGTDYCGLVTATGLTANTTYYYRLTLGGSDVTLHPSGGTTKYAEGTLKTLPTAGQDVDIGVLICGNEPDQTLFAMFGETFDAIYCNEWLYIDEGGGATATYRAAAPGPAAEALYSNGSPPSNLTADHNPNSSSSGMTSADFVEWRKSYRIRNRWSYLRRDASVLNTVRDRFQRLYPMRFMWDNHECQTTNGTARRSRPGENQFDAAFRAWWEYHAMGNPVNNDAGIMDTQPTYDGSTVIHPYFGEVIGDVEVLTLDQITFSDMATSPTQPRALADTARGSHETANQLKWAVDRINNSTAKFLIVCIGKPYQQGTFDYEDVAYVPGLLRTVGAKDDQTIILVSGDLHQPFVRVLRSTAWSGAATREDLTAPVTEVCIGPLEHTSITALADAGYSCLMSGNTVAGGQAASTFLYRPAELATNDVGITYNDMDATGGVDNHAQYVTAGQREKTYWNYLKIELRSGVLTLKIIAPLRASKVLWQGSWAEGQRVPT